MKIEDQWKAYKKYCIPDSAHVNQIEGSKQAFYAGFIALFEIVKMLPQFPDEFGFELLDGFEAQLLVYRKQKEQEAIEYARKQQSTKIKTN